MNQNDQEAVFNLRNVVKRREKAGSAFELWIESFQAYSGEFVAIVGESGSGKSTFLDILGMVLKPTHAEKFNFASKRHGFSYEIISSDESALAEIRRSHVGYVLQTGGLLPFLTVEENISLPCRINDLENFNDHVCSLVKRLGIAEQMKKKPQYLSGGQRQRVAIARALAHHPPVILADEPTAAVDRHTAEKIINEFKNLTSEMGVTLMMVTHDLALVKKVADQVYTLRLDTSDQEGYAVSRCLQKKKEIIK